MTTIPYKISVRNIQKRGKYFVLNFAGLVIGLFCAMMLIACIVYESTYDSFNINNERIVRLTTIIKAGTSESESARTSPLTGPTLKNEYPETRNYLRIREIPESALLVGEEKVIQNRIYLVDTSFFAFFTCNFIEGDESAIKQPMGIVLTNSLAVKLFGSAQLAMKQMLTIADENAIMMVTAVVEDFPHNSHLNFSALVPWESVKTASYWDFANCYTYIQFDAVSQIESFPMKLSGFADKFMQEAAEEYGVKYAFSVQPLSQIHLYSHLNEEITANGNVIYVYIYELLTIFFLVVSLSNYINMAVVNSMLRAKEIGVRKVLGAEKNSIRTHMFVESMATTLIAAVVAVALALIMMPYSVRLLGFDILKELTIDFTSAIIFIAGIFLVGMAAGVYPAIFLSSLSPSKILRGSVGDVGNGQSARRTLVTLQLAITIFLIIATAVAVEQVEFIRKKSLGLNPHNVLIGRVPNTFEALGKMEAVKTQLLNSPSVAGVAKCNFVPTHIQYRDLYKVKTDDGQEQSKMYDEIFVDKDFIGVLGLEIKEGRNFDPTNAPDYESYIVNETAVREFGWKNPIGSEITGPEDKKGKVIGVVRDFHTQSFHQKIEPLVVRFAKESYSTKFIYVKIKDGGEQQALTEINKIFADTYLLPGQYYFLEDIYQKVHEDDRRMNSILVVGAAVILFISCLGLYNLSAFIVFKRSKEVGVRKVMGASFMSIFFLHLRSFIGIIVVANVIAIPLGSVLINRWLEDFIYRTDVVNVMYLLGSLGTFLVIIFTLSFHAIQSSRLNPTSVLKEG